MTGSLCLCLGALELTHATNRSRPLKSIRLPAGQARRYQISEKYPWSVKAPEAFPCRDCASSGIGGPSCLPVLSTSKELPSVAASSLRRGVARQQPRHRYLEVVVLHQRAYNQLPSFNRCLRALSLICELFAVLFGGVVVFAIKQLDEGVLLGKVPASTGRSNTGHDALGKR